MKVKLLVSRAGLSFTQNAGEVIEVGEDEGKALINASQAVPVTEKRKAQKATINPKETRGSKDATV